jgi:glycosyltransferase involved in cell wall biosynthesis
VPDIRPYIKHACCVVAPLRLARGVQNKVLEAMSMARPVVATPQATEGIRVQSGQELLEAADEHGFADMVIQACMGHCDEMGRRGRERILRDYDWDTNLSRLDAWL